MYEIKLSVHIKLEENIKTNQKLNKLKIMAMYSQNENTILISNSFSFISF